MNGELATRLCGARRISGIPQHDFAVRRRGSLSVLERDIALRAPERRTEHASRAEAPAAVPRGDRRRAIEPDSTQVGFVLALIYSLGVVTVLTLCL